MRWVLVLLFCLGCESPRGALPAAACEDPVDCPLTEGTVTGRVVVVGIPGAGAVRQVGQFLDASPIKTQAPFAAYIAPGQVLAPDRLLLASTANFGAPLARGDDLPGAVLSVELGAATPTVVPPDFAGAGDQASALGGKVRLYTAQSSNFLNSVYHPDAATADYASVGQALGISINNAFGRPWFANALRADGADGSITVTDPDGRPLAAVVSRTAGGVFSGSATNRAGQIINGSLDTDSVGLAFIGPSPDGTRRAVFAGVNADGSLSQIHVLNGVDGLAEPGTIASIEQERAQARQGAGTGATRVGVVFNWVPNKVLFVADPLRNAVVAANLSQDAAVFRVSESVSLESEYFDVPIDLAPAVTEIVSTEFASGTTLAGGSDLYVANRGNGTVVRMTQEGLVTAVRSIDVPGMGLLGPNQINGIATSSDASRLWLTVTALHPDYPASEGFVVEIDAFGGNEP